MWRRQRAGLAEAGSGGEVAATGWPLGPQPPAKLGNDGEVAGRPRRLSGRGPMRRAGAVGRQAGCGEVAGGRAVARRLVDGEEAGVLGGEAWWGGRRRAGRRRGDGGGDAGTPLT